MAALSAASPRNICVLCEHARSGPVKLSRYWIVPAALILPVALLLQSLVTFRELNRMRSVYLRSQAATLAARLENLPEGAVESLADEEPALVDLEILTRSDDASRDLGALWEGRELYRTAEVKVDGEPVFRAWVPFHSPGGLRLARIDLATSAADFLTAPARNGLLLSTFTALALLAFSVYAVWSARRKFELEQLARLGRLSATLAHEIRNPLGTVKGFVQLAFEKGGETLGTLLEPALSEIARLEALVSDLLTYGRPRSPERKTLQWAEMARDLGAHFPRASIQTTDFEFRTDADMLKQILLNLLRNAAEAADEGAVRLSVSPGARHIRMAIEDNGPGIPQQVRRRLFEPFLTTKASGTGLGLSIARKLTELLEGRIAVMSRKPSGTRVELTFPR